jgi:hypothetical protein
MYSSIFRKGLLWASFIIFSIAGYATPLTWTVDATRGQTLGPVVGTFTYDADTNQVLSWDVFGLFGPGCQDGGPCGGSRQAGVSNDGRSAFFDFTSSGILNGLNLEFSAPLTNGGGTIPLIPGSDGGSGPGMFHIGPGSASYFNVLGTSNGSFTPILSGTVSAAPEPEYGFFIALLLLISAATAQYKSWRRKPFAIGK